MRGTQVRYIVLTWMCLFATLAYVHRSCVAVPAKIIQHDLAIDDTTMAWIFSSFFWGYAIFQIPGGLLADFWGSRKSLLIFVLLWSAAMVAMGLVQGLVALLVFRTIMGIAQAGLFPAAVNSFGKWFPTGERGLPNGLLGAFMMVGAMIGSALVGFLLEGLGLTWRQIFWIFGLPGLVCAVTFYWWFRDSPREHPSVNAAELAWIEESMPAPPRLDDEPMAEQVDGEVSVYVRDRQHAPIMAARDLERPTEQSVREASVPAGPERGAFGPAPEDRPIDIRVGFTWTLGTVLILVFLCGQHFFRGAGTLFYFSWFPTFLLEARQVPMEILGWMSALPLLGFTIGCAAGGRMMDLIYRRTGSHLLSRHGLAAVTMAICAVFLVASFWTVLPWTTVLLMTVSAFIAGTGGPAAYVVAIDVGKKNVATVFSIMNMAGNVGAALAPNVVIAWKDGFGWNAVLFLQAGIFLGAGLCWLALALTAAKCARQT